MAFRIIQPNYISGGGGSPLLTGLVSWWDLTTDANDDHSTNNLSLAGSPSFGSVGGYDSVTVSAGNHLYLGSPLDLTEFTVCAWVYPTGTSNAYILCELEVENSTGWRWRLAQNGASNVILYVRQDSATIDNETAYGIMSTSSWTLVWGEFSTATGVINIYSNGNASASATKSTGITSLAYSKAFGIGGDGDGGGSGTEFTGSIRSVGVWSRILSSSERATIYNSGTPITYSAL